MTIFITVVIIIFTVTFVVYPFFRKTAVTPVVTTKTTSGKRTVKQAQKSSRKQNDVDSEIERRVSEIRNKVKAVCPGCGMSYKEGSRFCAQCGADLSTK